MWLGLDTTKPHPARIYDYLLGGKDNFAVDRETAESAMRSWRSVRTAARENRAFLGRAVRYLVREAGIRQFLDVGTGLPATNNVHEVAQALEPECRVVYADNDPIVLAHARALLASGPEGRTAYIDADLREPEKILASRAVAETLDLSEPVALMLVAVLHLAGRAYQGRGLAGQLRTIDELAELAFRGLDMVDPGVVPVSEWRPEGNRPRPLPAEVNANSGVGRKP